MRAVRRSGRHIATGNTLHGGKSDALFSNAAADLVRIDFNPKRLFGHRITKWGGER
jgi:hypothetical protein